MIYKLNIRSGYTAPITVHCSYGDSGEKVEFIICDGDTEYSLDGTTAYVHGYRRDGADFGPYSCTINDNKVSFTLTTGMTMCEGGHIAEIVISKGSKVTGTANFGILVERAAFPNGISYSSDPAVYKSILNYVSNAISQIESTVIPSEAIDIDNTLSIEGAAAEASETGKIKVSTKSISDTLVGLNTTYLDLHKDVEWEIGSLDATDGHELVATNRIRFKDYYNVSGLRYIDVTMDSTYGFVADWYDKDFKYLTSAEYQGTWRSGTQKVVVPLNARYLRMLMRFNSGADISTTEAANMKLFGYVGASLDASNESSDVLSGTTWEVGSLNPPTGLPIVMSTRIRTNSFVKVTPGEPFYVNVKSGYKYVIDWYDDAFGFLPDANFSSIWVSESKSFIVPDDANYAKFILATTNDATIHTNAISNITIKRYYVEGIINDDVEYNWIQGSLNSATGTITALKTRLRSDFILAGKGSRFRAVNRGYDHYVFKYDLNKTFVSSNGWNYEDFVAEEDCYVRIVLRNKNADSTEIATADIPTIAATEQDIIYYPTYSLENIQYTDDINTLDTVDLSWELGSLTPGYGGNANSTTRIRSRHILCGKGTKVIATNLSSYNIIVYTYDTDMSYLTGDAVWTRPSYETTQDGYIRVLARKVDNSEIQESEISTIASSIKIIRTFPQYLMDVPTITSDTFFPGYYSSQVETAIETIKDNMKEAGIMGDTFMFVSDIHWSHNLGHSARIAKYMLEKLNINKILCGGDLVTQGDEDVMIESMRDCVSAFKKAGRFYVAFGNHDTNFGVPPITNKSYTYSLMQKQMENYDIKYGSYCYFHFDNEITRTRYIFLDTGYEGTTLDSAQQTWINETLNSTPNNYNIIVVGHIIYMPKSGVEWHVGLKPEDLERTSFMTTVCNTLDTFNSNNTSSGREVVAIFGGHIHIDADFTTTGGIPIVLIDCNSTDSFSTTSTGSQNVMRYTVNETCFDIVTVNYNAKTINCVRIGRGSNRTFTY